MRVEHDLLGDREIESDALYGIHTLRAAENFPVVFRKTNIKLIRAVATVKKAAALAHAELDKERAEIYRAIAAACDKVIAGGTDEAFVVDALQGGAGTSTNMNVNEVIANIALELCGKPYGDYSYIHPLDDVNRGQSTNDVYPTALRIAAIGELRRLSEACAKLQESLQVCENKYGDIKKLGRTELMDAVPITLGEEFGAYAQAISRDRWRLYKVEERLRQVNLGGTAVGTSTATDKRYRFLVIEKLRELTGYGLAAAEYPMDPTQNCDVFVEVSGLLKSMAVNLMKISGDLRLMNSGPRGGLGEIRLAPLQAGSSIMPGKVNPVIPECVMQIAMRVIANDTAITLAAAHGEFELNAFMPLIADSLLELLHLLERAASILREKCVELLTPDQDRCRELLEKSLAFAASYVPQLGYDTVSDIIKRAGGEPSEVRRMLDEAAGKTK